MRGVQWRGAEADDEFVRFMETCVQCRGCEPACPSGVPFGRLMEGTREALADERPHGAALAAAGFARARPAPAAARRLDAARRSPSDCGWSRARLGLAALAAAPRPAAASRAPATDVWLFTGCVMDAWHARHPPRHRRRDRRRSARRIARPAPSGAAAARCTSTPGSTTRPPALAERVDGVDARRRADRRQLGRLRRGAEGLRPPARHRRGGGVRRRVWSTSTSGWRRGSTGCRRRGAGSAPSSSRTRATCATCSGPTCPCAPCSATSPTWSSSTTTVCAAAPAAPTRRCSRSSPATIRDRKLAAIERAAQPFGRDGRGQRQPRLRDAPRRGRRDGAPPDRPRRRGARPRRPGDHAFAAASSRPGRRQLRDRSGSGSPSGSTRPLGSSGAMAPARLISIARAAVGGQGARRRTPSGRPAGRGRRAGRAAARRRPSPSPLGGVHAPPERDPRARGCRRERPQRITTSRRGLSRRSSSVE